MPGGRPSKYDVLYCDQLFDHMSEGGSIEEFAGVIGVSKQTIYTWTKENPEFLDAYERGKMASCAWWARQGREGLYSESWNSNGIGGGSKSLNSAVWKFNMANRFGWREKVDHSGEVDTTGVKNKLKELLKDPETAKAARAVALALTDKSDSGDDDIEG